MVNSVSTVANYASDKIPKPQEKATPVVAVTDENSIQAETRRKDNELAEGSKTGTQINTFA